MVDLKHFVWFVALCVMLWAGATQAAWLGAGEYTDDASTLALYHLNQSSGTTILDDNGSGRTAHNGAINGPPSPTWSAGLFGNGLNGASKDVCGNLAFNNAPSTLGNNFTIETYMKRDVMVNAAHLVNIPAYVFVVLNADNVEGWVRAGVNTSWGFQVANGMLANQQDWNHIAITVASDGDESTISLYFDGVFQSSATGGTLNPAAGDEPLYFGSRNNTSDEGAFAGTIDEVRISSVVRTDFGVPEPITVALLSLGTLLVRRRN